MSRKYRTYTEEFKQEAIKLVTQEGYKIAEAARSWGFPRICWASGSGGRRAATRVHPQVHFPATSVRSWSVCVRRISGC